MHIDTLKTNDSISTIINELAQYIYFETNKATLSPASAGVLNKIIALLKTQPFKQLQIEGHTDNRGTTKGMSN
nr:OmpA family protein [Paraflavitalea speifideiaquila]